MLASLKNMFKVPDLRNKILFTLAMKIVIYRLGSQIPVPGVYVSQINHLQDQASGSGGALAFIQLFSGGALTVFAIFALGIMPYITASIILQVLGVVIPKLEEWQNQGAIGQRKITQWTRYLTVAISLMQAIGVTYLFHYGGSGFFTQGNPLNVDIFAPGPGQPTHFDIWHILLSVITLTAGATLLMWIGELMTERGVGNGMSLLIFVSVASRIPSDFGTVKAEKGFFVMLIVIALFILLMVAIVFVENGQRRIPVQFAKRVVGRRMYGGQSTYIPLKVDASGVIAIIFASSVLYLPVIIAQVLPSHPGSWGYEVQQFVQKHLVSPTSPLYLALYGVLIIAFCYFYNAIQFDPHQQADNIRKQGGFIPGIRPGPQTERYLAKILNRITLPGAIFTTFVALGPLYVLSKTLGGQSGAQLGFFGISVLILVEVALETVKQIDSHLMMRNYEGFLK